MLGYRKVVIQLVHGPLTAKRAHIILATFLQARVNRPGSDAFDECVAIKGMHLLGGDSQYTVRDRDFEEFADGTLLLVGLSCR